MKAIKIKNCEFCKHSQLTHEGLGIFCSLYHKDMNTSGKDAEKCNNFIEKQN